MKFPRRFVPWLGALAGILGMIWVLRDFEPDQFFKTISGSNPVPLLLLPVFIVLEQVVRAIKWRQLLHPLHSIGVGRLFAAIMVGYFTNLIAPLGVSPFVRGWLIARQEGMRFATVLATVVLDRISDGLAFLVFAAFAIVNFDFPDENAGIRTDMTWGAITSLVLFSTVIIAIIAFKLAVRN